MGSPERHQRAGSNDQRIIQDAKRALRLLQLQSKRPEDNTFSASTLKLTQRSNRRVIAEALQRQHAQKHRERARQQHAATKARYVCSRGTGKDAPIRPSFSTSIDSLAIDFHADCAYHDEGCCDFLIPDDEDCGASIQLGRGWKVVAIYLLSGRDDRRYYYRRDRHYLPIKGDMGRGYYLAINPVTSQVLCSSFVPCFTCWNGSWYYWDYNEWDYDMYYEPLASPSLDGLDAALRSDLSPGSHDIESAWPLRLSCSNMMCYARSRLSAADPKREQHQQPACQTEAVLAMCANFIWSCPRILSAGQFAPWQVKVWCPARLRSIVRLQACFRGWALRRSLYSPYTELGQRRLRRLWASFQNDQ